MTEKTISVVPEGQTVKFRDDKADSNALVFTLENQKEILRFDANGDAFVRGEKVDSNLAVYQAFRDFLAGAGVLTQSSKPVLNIEIHGNPRDIYIKEGGKTLRGIQSLNLDVSCCQIPPFCRIDVLDPTTPGLSSEFQQGITETVEIAQRHGVSVRLLKLSDLAIDENPDEQKQAEATLKGLVQL